MEIPFNPGSSNNLDNDDLEPERRSHNAFVTVPELSILAMDLDRMRFLSLTERESSHRMFLNSSGSDTDTSLPESFRDENIAPMVSSKDLAVHPMSEISWRKCPLYLMM